MNNVDLLVYDLFSIMIIFYSMSSCKLAVQWWRKLEKRWPLIPFIMIRKQLSSIIFIIIIPDKMTALSGCLWICGGAVMWLLSSFCREVYFIRYQFNQLMCSKNKSLALASKSSIFALFRFWLKLFLWGLFVCVVVVYACGSTVQNKFPRLKIQLNQLKMIYPMWI